MKETITISLNRYEELNRIKDNYEKSDIQTKDTEIENLKAKVYILESDKMFNTQYIPNEVTATVNNEITFILNELLDKCNMLGYISHNKVKEVFKNYYGSKRLEDKVKHIIWV